MFHHRHLPQLSAFALVFLCAGPARAADAPPSLAAALEALKPPKGETVLAVGAVSAFRPVLLVQQRRQSPHFTWYGSWAGPGTPFPTFRSAVGVPASEKTQARAQSKFIMVALPVQSPLEQAAILRRWSAGLLGIAKNHSWDGFVLDCQPVGSAP